MEKKIIISAYNVHQGGGKVLLDALLRALNQMDVLAMVYLDERYAQTLKGEQRFQFKSINPSVISRYQAEQQLKKEHGKYDLLFCFGNLPPMFQSKIKTFIFVQNKYLVSKNFICWSDARTALRTFVEKIYFEIFKSNKYNYLVQSRSMKHSFDANQKDSIKCSILPFSPFSDSHEEEEEEKGSSFDNLTKHRFIYVASGEPHKNHRNLIEAWKYLAEKNFRPQLDLVIDINNFPTIKELIESSCKSHDLKIRVIKSLPRKELLDSYATYDGLIYPSKLESFGLPLIEAEHYKIPIIASELDYVRDVVSPVETFDPGSPASIADATLRFLKVKNTGITIFSPKDFIHELISNAGASPLKKSSKPRRLLNSKVFFALKLILSLFLLYWVIEKGELSLENFKIAITNFRLIAIFFGLTFFQLVLASLRTQYLMQPKVADIHNLNKVYNISFASLFINCVAPISLVADVFRIRELINIDSNLNKDNIFYASILSKVFSILSLIVMFLFFGVFIKDKPDVFVNIMYVLSFMLLFSTFGYFISRKFSFELLKSAKKLKNDFFRNRIINLLEYRNQFLRRKGNILYVLLLSFLIQLANTASFVFIINSINPDFAGSLVKLYFLIPLGIFTMMLPISFSGLGIGHIAFSKLLALENIYNGADVFNIFFTFSYLFNLLGFIPFLKLLKRK